MKRDMDLVREILREGEKLPERTELIKKIEIPGHSSEEISYHLLLLSDAGLMEIFDLAKVGRKMEGYSAVRLTWAGHEFLASVQNESFWSKAKAHTVKTTGSLTMEALKAAIPYLLKELTEGRLKL